MIKKQNKKGFTLVELLIVIAILGTLAVVVLLALDPIQQLARTRDAGRKSGVTQLGHAVTAYATTHNGAPPAELNWSTTLVTGGEIQVAPSAIAYSVTGSAACTSNPVNGTWCYDISGINFVVYARLESKSSLSLCTAGQVAFTAFSSLNARGGTVCAAAGTTTLAPATLTFVD